MCSTTHVCQQITDSEHRSTNLQWCKSICVDTHDLEVTPLHIPTTWPSALDEPVYIYKASFTASGLEDFAALLVAQ